MPPFGDLGATKLSFLLSYLRSLQGKGAPVEVSGNAETGKELFWGKAGCSECHMVSGRGGFLGPDLSSYGESHSVKEMEAAIVNPERKAGPRRVGAEVTTKDGNVYSGLVRNEDNFSMQLQARDGTFHLLSKSELTAIHYQSQSLMPTDYATKLTAEELNNLVAYLARSAKGKSDPGEKQ